MSRAGAAGEEDGGVAEILGVLLALLLCNRYWGCNGEICLLLSSCIVPGLFIESPLVGLLIITHRSWSFWLPNPAPTLEWRDPYGGRQETTPGRFWVLHQAGSERHLSPLVRLDGRLRRSSTQCFHSVLLLFRWNTTRFMTGNSTLMKMKMADMYKCCAHKYHIQ